MRIGIDARFLGYVQSGLARYSDSLLHAMAGVESANQYVVFVNARLDWKLKLGEGWKVVPLRGNPFGLAGMRRLRRAAQREGLDILHSHYPLTPRGLDVPTLVTVHDVVPFRRDSGVYRSIFPLWRWLWPYVFAPMSVKRAKWVLCVSESTREKLCGLIPEVFHKSIVVHSGIDEDFREELEPSTGDLIRKRLNLPEEYVLYSGSIREDKNVEGVLRVFARLRQRNTEMDEMRLVIEYPGPEARVAELKKLIGQFELGDRVRFLHDVHVEERRVVFEDARVLLVMSREEGFGFAIPEAQQCELPVVAADSGALPEIAGEHGALLVDPDETEECARVLERVLTDDNLREYLSVQGRENVERFDWGKTAKEIQQIHELLFYPRSQVDLPGHQPLAARFVQWLQS